MGGGVVSVTISVTRSRVTAVRMDAAALLAAEGWHPYSNTVMDAIDRAAGWSRPDGDTTAEQLAWQAFYALTEHLFGVRHLGGKPLADWERTPGRTQDDVVAALRGAAKAVTA